MAPLQNTLSVYLILLFIMIINTQNFTVDISQAILLHQNKSNIKTTGKDLEGNLYVSFENKEVRKYSADFTSYTSYILLEAADTFNTRGTTMSSTLANGTFLNLGDRKIVIRTNQMTVIRNYNYDTFESLQVFQIGSTILGQMGFPIKVRDVSHMFHAVSAIDSVLVAYKGQIHTLLNYSSTFNSNSTILTSSIFQSSTTTSASSNNFSATLKGYISLSNNNTYSMTIILSFIFNYTLDHYDLTSQNITYTSIYSSTAPVTKLSISNGILMMQSNATGITSIYDINSKVMGNTNNIPLNQTFTFFYIYNTFYVLQSTGLCKLSYNSSTKTLSLSNLVVALPYNTYGLNFGSMVNPFYTPNLPFLYKAGPCTGNSVYSGGSCSSYTCSVQYCQSCGVIQTFCSICSSGYVVNNNKCEPASNISNSSNATNSTSSSNSSNSSNSSSSSNSTNSNQTSNSTTNSTNNSSASTLTDDNLEMSPFDQMSSFQSYMKWLFNILAFLISIPTARRVLSPAFYFFGVFDDIYFYQFHDRLYGETMNSVFDNINTIQNNKWSLLNSQIFSIFGTTVDQFQNSINLQSSYQQFHYSSTQHPTMGSEALLYNCYNFFIFALPITIILFIWGRFMFHSLYKYRISKPFRKFSFWSILVLLIFDGNIQQFTFYMVNQWKNSMSLHIQTKIVKILSVIFGFILIVLSVGIYFKSYSFYCKLNRFMMDNNKNYLLGQTGLLLQYGIKNIVLGFAHSLLRVWHYEYMIIILICIEIIFFALLLCSIAFNIYKSQAKIWIYLCLNLNKICLLITLSIDHESINTQTIQSAQQIIIILEIFLFLFGIIYQTLQSLCQIFISIKSFIFYQDQLKIKQRQNMKEILNYKSTHVYIKNINCLKTNKTSQAGRDNPRIKANGNGLRKVLTINKGQKLSKSRGFKQPPNIPNLKIFIKKSLY